MPSTGAERPNILWIFIEDQDPRYSCYGEPLVNTPHIDALAEQGVLFERAYAPCPVCSPSRSAILTGSYQIRNGTHVQRSSRFPGEEIYLPEGTKTVPELFRDAGYFTYNRGKDDYNFAYDREKLYSTGNAGIEDLGKMKGVQAGGGDWSECPPDMPFFAQMQTNGGKNGYTLEQVTKVLQKLEVNNPQLVDPADVTVPPQYPDIPEMRERIANQLNTMLVTDIEVRNMVARLKEDGHWGNTIIFLISDHGALFPRAKQMCYEEGVHIPLIVAAPGMADLVSVIPAGVRRTEQTALLDVAATSLVLAGIPIPDYMDSVNLFGESSRRNHIFAARDRCEWTVDRVRSVIGERYHYIKNFMTDRPLAQPSFRDGWPEIVRAKEMYERGELTPAQALPYGPRPAEELYDLQEDPHELVNLADDPDHQEILRELRRLVEDWIEDTDDKGQYPESKAALQILKKMFPEQAVDPVFEGL
ncbi:MAG: sulfatase [Desulfobacterales bacterium]